MRNNRIRPGGPFIKAPILATGDDLTEKRAPLVMPTPFRRQNGIIDVMPSLLLSTLAITVVALPIGERSTDLAPRTPPKIQVQAEQQEPSPLQRGIVGTIPLGPSQAAHVTPQQKYAVWAENRSSSLTTGIPAGAIIPQGKALPDVVSARKFAVQVDGYPNLQITTFSLPALAPAIVIDLSTVEKRPSIAVEQIQRPLTLVAIAAIPIPPGLQIGNSSPPKYAVQAQQSPTLIRVTLPDFAPIGTQLQDHETKPHYEVLALATPNLTLSTLIPPAGALPIGNQLSDSAWTDYEHNVTQIDDFQSLLALNPPPPPVTPVVPGFIGAGGGVGGYRCPQGWVWDPHKNACRKLKLIERPHQHLKALLDEIGSEILYGELTQPAASEATQSKAAKLVRPFSDDKRTALPAAAVINWRALEQDAKRTASLVKLWLAQQDEQSILDEDDDFIFFQ